MSYLSEANFGDGENGPYSVISSVGFRVSRYCALVVRSASSFTRLKVRMVDLCKNVSCLKRIRKEMALNCVYSLFFGCENHLKRKL